MPYRKAYSYGETPEEALITFRINELSLSNKIEKYKLYIINKPKNISNMRFELLLNNSINYKLTRKKTKTESRAYNYLVSVYGYEEFDKIMDIYNNENSMYNEVALCYIDNENKVPSESNFSKLKCYRFLY